jgi:hypothetical protein
VHHASAAPQSIASGNGDWRAVNPNIAKGSPRPYNACAWSVPEVKTRRGRDSSKSNTASASADLMRNELTVKLISRGDRVTVTSLIEALERTLSILRDIEDSAAQAASSRRTDWQILSISLNGSLRVTVTNDAAPPIIQTYMGGIRMIERAPEAPPAFDLEALENTRRLSGLLSKDLQAIVFSSPGESEVMLTQHAAANIDALTQTAPRPHFDHTVLTGVLEQITYTVDKHKFRLRRGVSGLAVDCTFPPALLEQVKTALPHRVRVSGGTKYNRVGDPISMQVETIELLPGKSQLPQFDDLTGIDITGGEDAAQYVGRLRSDDEAD